MTLHCLTASQLTEDEVALIHYVTDLTNWLDPFHNFLRPRGEATKVPPKNGHSSNDGASADGHGRKPEDAPQISEPPESILSYFKSEQRHILLMSSESTSRQTHAPNSRQPSRHHVQSMRSYISPLWHKRQVSYPAP